MVLILSPISKAEKKLEIPVVDVIGKAQFDQANDIITINGTQYRWSKTQTKVKSLEKLEKLCDTMSIELADVKKQLKAK